MCFPFPGDGGGEQWVLFVPEHHTGGEWRCSLPTRGTALFSVTCVGDILPSDPKRPHLFPHLPPSHPAFFCHFLCIVLAIATFNVMMWRGDIVICVGSDDIVILPSPLMLKLFRGSTILSCYYCVVC